MKMGEKWSDKKLYLSLARTSCKPGYLVKWKPQYLNIFQRWIDKLGYNLYKYYFKVGK